MEVCNKITVPWRMPVRYQLACDEAVSVGQNLTKDKKLMEQFLEVILSASSQPNEHGWNLFGPFLALRTWRAESSGIREIIRTYVCRSLMAFYKSFMCLPINAFGHISSKFSGLVMTEMTESHRVHILI